MRTSIAIGLGSLAGFLVVRERRSRLAAERFAAAALESLLKAIDANDAQTGAHVRRVASYAIILARAADLGEHECREVERVALFHDIGKIHEALFDIIHESDRLTPAERQAIATHPARGAEVLAPLSCFQPELSAGVLAHHERWDGTGYPRGLRGAEIPITARIVTLADTFDAITHSRRYRGGRDAGDAARVIREGRGTQFDPDLVDLMLLPPVFDAVVRAHAAARRQRAPARQERRHGEQPETAPDVTFRWRSETRAPRIPDRRRRGSRS